MTFLSKSTIFILQFCLLLLGPFLPSLDASKQFKIGNYVDIDNIVSRATHHELIDLRELYHIWKPIIEQVGQEAIAQFQEKESVQIRSIETANSQIANGVYYRIRLELDQSEQIELIMLDHEEPHFMWLPSDDPRSESGQEMRPLLPRIEFRGPMELIFPASREVRMKLPRYVDAGSFRKLILEKGAHVNTSGFVEATLLNALVVNNIALMSTARPTFEELQYLTANGLLGNTFTHKLILSLKNIPKIMLSSDIDFKQLHSVEYIDDGSSTGVNFNKRDAVFESDELLKVKRKSHNEIIVYNSTLAEQNLRTSTKRATSLKSTSLRHVNELHEGYEIEIPINPHLAGLLQQFFTQLQTSNLKGKTIKRILSGKAEAVKCFIIPMRVTDQSGEAIWHVLAIKRITGQTVVLNVHKLPEVPDIAVSEGILQHKNETFTELTNQLASLVELSLRQNEYRNRLPLRSDKNETKPSQTSSSQRTQKDSSKQQKKK